MDRLKPLRDRFKLGLPFILSFFKRINVDKILQRFRALIRQSLEELANDGAAGHFKGFAISCNENRGNFFVRSTICLIVATEWSTSSIVVKLSAMCSLFTDSMIVFKNSANRGFVPPFSCFT